MSVGYLYHMTLHDLDGPVAGHGFLHWHILVILNIGYIYKKIFIIVLTHWKNVIRGINHKCVCIQVKSIVKPENEARKVNLYKSSCLIFKNKSLRTNSNKSSFLKVYIQGYLNYVSSVFSLHGACIEACFCWVWLKSLGLYVY